ncbi:MAG TPA: hypothetical protein VK470_08105 [Bacteroidota bacterium]|nr:hypothetical protein [Bacteroidota bacterium]
MKLRCFLAILLVLNSGCKDKRVNSSIDNATWKSLGLAGKRITQIKTSPNYIYACTEFDGIYRHSKYADDQLWEYIGLNVNSLINGTDTVKGMIVHHTQGVSDVIINPNNENELIASILVFKPGIPGIYKTINGGRSWSEADSGFGFETPWWWPGHIVDTGRVCGARVLFNPADQFSNIFAGHLDAGIAYRSSNSGDSWIPVINYPVNVFSSVCSFGQDPANPNTIFAGGQSSNGIASTLIPAWLWKSTDGGKQWKMVIPPPVYLNENGVFSICVTNSPHVIYLGMRGFIYGSLDDGLSWQTMVLADHPEEVFIIVANPFDCRHIVGATGSMLVETKDAGRTWIKLKIPDEFKGIIDRLYWDKQTGNLYVAAGDSEGVFVLTYDQLKNL